MPVTDPGSGFRSWLGTPRRLKAARLPTRKPMKQNAFVRCRPRVWLPNAPKQERRDPVAFSLSRYLDAVFDQLFVVAGIEGVFDADVLLEAGTFPQHHRRSKGAG